MSASPLPSPLPLPARGGVAWEPGSQRPARAVRLLGPALSRRRGAGGLVLFIVLLFTVFAGPLVTRVNPNQIELAAKLQGPTATHPLGTDNLGRDMLARLLHGGRTAVSLGLLAVAGSVALACITGGVAGYFGGIPDLLLSAVFNVLLTVPGLILTLAIIGIMGAGQTSLLFALIGAEWAGQARIVRGAVLEAREQGYVEAARAVGARSSHILWRHIAPNVAGTIAVLATLDLAGVVLTVTSLSFLGIGVQPPQADWGTMLNDSRQFAGTYPQLMLLPGLCIVTFAVAANLAGDALRDLLDPGRR
jgi:ABC-type dipeptide/oligopeptide/nickel transport system permease subunit